jgi:hypothetical protein
MKAELHAHAGEALTDIPPLRRDIGSPGAWRYLINYVLLGSSTVIILMEMIESGVWRKLWCPVLLIILAMSNLAALQAAERKRAEPSRCTEPGDDVAVSNRKPPAPGR